MSNGVSWRACWRSKITFGNEVQPDSATDLVHFAATFLSVAAATGFGIAAMSLLLLLLSGRQYGSQRGRKTAFGLRQGEASGAPPAVSPASA